MELGDESVLCLWAAYSVGGDTPTISPWPPGRSRARRTPDPAEQSSSWLRRWSCAQRLRSPPGGAGPEAAVAAGAGVLWVVGHYLLSASTRRSMSSSMLPVLGRSRLASRSLSSALGRPS